jgi:prepilin signal peptidase PulO-like enzyme (type II secretory pathway)
LVAIGAVLGLVVGTAIATLLDRLYTGAPWGGPLLACVGCRQPLPRIAALGTAGYVMLRGRCPGCGAALPARLLYLAPLGAVVYSVAFALTSGAQLLLVCLFAAPLLALTAADFERRLLPNRIMYPTLLLGLALAWAWPGRGALDTLAGGLLGIGVMLLLFLLLPGFGFGDVKLAGLLGLVAGLSAVLPALFLAALASAVAGVLLLVTRRVRLRGSIAYGPYLALAAFLVMLGT